MCKSSKQQRMLVTLLLAKLQKPAALLLPGREENQGEEGLPGESPSSCGTGTETHRGAWDVPTAADASRRKPFEQKGSAVAEKRGRGRKRKRGRTQYSHKLSSWRPRNERARRCLQSLRSKRGLTGCLALPGKGLSDARAVTQKHTHTGKREGGRHSTAGSAERAPATRARTHTSWHTHISWHTQP